MDDLIVIGAGSGGLAAAKRAAALGKTVSLIENDTVGGTCVSYGCVPKKLWHSISSTNHMLSLAKENGWDINQTNFNWNSIQPKLAEYIKKLNLRHEEKCKSLGINLIKGTAKLINKNQVIVNQKTYEGKHILIAVGAKADRINIEGGEFCETSYEFFSWKTQPKAVCIWGGGYIAVELASILNALGTKVHIIIRQPLVLRGFDNEMREFIQDKYIKRGIEIHTETTINRIEKSKNHLEISLKDGGKVTVDKVLQAVGRIPNTSHLGCSEIGIKMDEKMGIIVNEDYLTSQPTISAIGDCINKIQLTPVAIAQGRQWVDRHFSKTLFPVDFNNIPTAIFSHPESASIGYSEEAARKKYENVTVKKLTFNPLTTALAVKSKEPIFMKLIFEGEKLNIVGIHMVCEGAAEIIQALAAAFQKGITKKDLDLTMALHPTISEEFVTIY